MEITLTNSNHPVKGKLTGRVVRFRASFTRSSSHAMSTWVAPPCSHDVTKLHQICYYDWWVTFQSKIWNDHEYNSVCHTFHILKVEYNICFLIQSMISKLSCGASSTDVVRASRSSHRQRRVARRGFRHAGMQIDMQGSLELRSLFPFVSRPRAYIIHVIGTLWIRQWTPISYLSLYS